MSFLKRQAVYAFIGVVFMVLAARFDYHRLRYLAPPLVLVALALCAAVLVLGPAINGARRWFIARPGELPAVRAREARALPLRRDLPRAQARAADVRRADQAARAAHADLRRPHRRRARPRDDDHALRDDARDLPRRGRAGAAARRLHRPSRSGSGSLAIWIEPYRRARVFSFLDPWSDAQGAGFQIVQATIGIGSGGFTGAGLGEGVGKVSYLPEAHTDMIFAVIGEELGLVGATFVICAFAAPRCRRLPHRDALQGSVRKAARGRDHRARLRAGGDQPRGGARASLR